MKRIGILGGASDQATADYYRRLNQGVNDWLGGRNTAELLISSMNFAFCEACVRNERWDELAAYLADRTAALEAGGAGLVICVSNTLHRLCDRFMAGRSIPFLHIADPAARAIKAAGLTRVALLGTRPVMATDFMKQRYAGHGIEIVVPDADEQETVDRIIFDELCRGRFTAASKALYLDVVDRLHASGAEGVILDCTEIPLLIAQPDRPALPMFDTAALHVHAAIEWAMGEPGGDG